MVNSVCPYHHAALLEGMCPAHPCLLGTPGLRRRVGTQEYAKTLSRAGVWAWKPLRTKGRCIPCEKAKARVS